MDALDGSVTPNRGGGNSTLLIASSTASAFIERRFRFHILFPTRPCRNLPASAQLNPATRPWKSEIRHECIFGSSSGSVPTFHSCASPMKRDRQLREKNGPAPTKDWNGE
jgi:hypothetical protein